MRTNWNAQWKNESNRNYWNLPDKNVIKFSETYGIGKSDKVLDLGCGIGRHSIYLAKRDAQVYAIDESEIAIKKLRESAGNLNIQAEICDYLIFKPAVKFDYIIAFNVIYHGDFEHFKKSILKCYELLNQNEKLFFTCPSRNDGKYENGNKVAEHTYESLNSIHPGDIHYFTNKSELENIMYEFKNADIQKEEYYWDNNGTSQFASNFIVIADKGL